MSLNIYESLGVRPVINAAGTFTSLGGSLMAPEVVASWAEAAQHFVDMTELQHAVGTRIAALLSVPAALVTGGAAHAIALGVAASITAKYPAYPSRDFSAPADSFEVLRQASHRDLYDRQLELPGVQIVDVETVDDVHNAISHRTIMLMAYNLYEPIGLISHTEWLRCAQQHGLPTLLDAAADTPPVENLAKYVCMGYDMVAFSGGKAICGPQDTGLLLGNAELIELAKQNASPFEGTIGRVTKVSKEDMVALWRAIDLYLQTGNSIAERCRTQLQQIVEIISEESSLTCHWITPDTANHFPHLCLQWDEARLGFTASQLARVLRQGRPPIATGRVYGTGEDGLLLSAVNLQTGEATIVAKRIMQAFHDLQRAIQPGER